MYRYLPPLQPRENFNEWRLIYFISFLLLVGFFVLNMFVGVVVENFHRCRAEQEKEERARRAAKRAKKIEERRRSEFRSNARALHCRTFIQHFIWYAESIKHPFFSFFNYHINRWNPSPTYFISLITFGLRLYCDPSRNADYQYRTLAAAEPMHGPFKKYPLRR